MDVFSAARVICSAIRYGLNNDVAMNLKTYDIHFAALPYCITSSLKKIPKLLMSERSTLQFIVSYGVKL